MQETKVRPLGQEDPLVKEMATHSSILAWEIPWTEEPGGPQSTGLQKSQTWLGDWTPPPPTIDQQLTWTEALQAPLSMGFSRQEYWSELPFPSAGDLPDSGVKPRSPLLTGRFFTTVSPGKPNIIYRNYLKKKSLIVDKASTLNEITKNNWLRKIDIH